MDKNTISGLLIIGAILFGFSWWTGKQQKEVMRQKAAADSVWMAEHPAPEADSVYAAQQGQEAVSSAKADSVVAGHMGQALFSAMKGEERFYTLENDKVKITVSNLGGRLAAAEVKGYTTYGGEPLTLFTADDSKFDARFFIRNRYGDVQVNTASYYFATEAPATAVATEAPGNITMRLAVDSASWVEYVYTLDKDAYTVDFSMVFHGMEGVLSNQSDMTVEWGNTGRQQEKGWSNENTYADLTYMFPGTTDMEKLGLSKESKSEQVVHKVKWVAFKQQFFSSILVADDAFASADLKYDTYAPESGKIKKYNAVLTVPMDQKQESYGFSFYLGPNKFSVLKKYGLGFEKLVPLGWGIFGWINRFIVIPVFDFLSKYIGSFGIIILLLTIFIKIIISPLTYKSYLSSAKMRLLKPELDEIAAKYPKSDEMAKKQQATMDLYKRAGVSPMGGCLPMLIQFPILIAMFRFFPAAIELRGESFLWADDLSSYDSILSLPFNIPAYGSHVSLFALLMALSLYFYTRMNSAQMSAAGPQMAGMKFMSLYLMPVMMLFWFNSYASGLSYYYLLSNLISMGQTYLFRYAVDDGKLHRQMKENAKKPRKKSKWSERYEQLLKEQQRQQKAAVAERAGKAAPAKSRKK